MFFFNSINKKKYKKYYIHYINRDKMKDGQDLHLYYFFL